MPTLNDLKTNEILFEICDCLPFLIAPLANPGHIARKLAVSSKIYKNWIEMHSDKAILDQLNFDFTKNLEPEEIQIYMEAVIGKYNENDSFHTNPSTPGLLQGDLTAFTAFLNESPESLKFFQNNIELIKKYNEEWLEFLEITFAAPEDASKFKADATFNQTALTTIIICLQEKLNLALEHGSSLDTIEESQAEVSLAFEILRASEHNEDLCEQYNQILEASKILTKHGQQDISEPYTKRLLENLEQFLLQANECFAAAKHNDLNGNRCFAQASYAKAVECYEIYYSEMRQDPLSNKKYLKALHGKNRTKDYIVKLIKKNRPSLTKLDITSLNLNAYDFYQIFNALAQNDYIHSVDLSNNKLGQDHHGDFLLLGVEELSKLINGNKNLREICMENNPIFSDKSITNPSKIKYHYETRDTKRLLRDLVASVNSSNLVEFKLKNTNIDILDPVMEEIISVLVDNYYKQRKCTVDLNM